MLPPSLPPPTDGATCIIQVLSHHYQRAVHGTSISQSVCRSLARLEPFQMYQSPPRSSVSLNQMLIRSFIRPSVRPSVRLPARSLRKSPFRKRTKLSQRRRGEKKGGKEVRFESERRRKENVSAIGIQSLARRYRSKESDNITYERTNERRPIFDLQILRQKCITSIV